MSAGIDFHIHFYNLDTLKPINVIQPEKITKSLGAPHVHTEISSNDHEPKEKVEKRPISNE